MDQPFVVAQEPPASRPIAMPAAPTPSENATGRLFSQLRKPARRPAGTMYSLGPQAASFNHLVGESIHAA
jgi:hypothetical protein